MTVRAARLTPDLAATFKTPAVRHLAWLCQAPQLINSPLSFRPSQWLPDNTVHILRHWDQHPQAGPGVLCEQPHYRLGLYTEQLYDCLLSDLLGWTVVARNLPVRAGGVTLGELDFVVRNPHTGDNEHHEIAIKFYLGYPYNNPIGVRWYGPNARDRLDLKSERMLHLQSQRCRLPETLDTLVAADIEPPSVSRIFMPGYLFYPFDIELPTPVSADANHLRGRWLSLSDACQRTDTDTWVILRKPDWLGPWSQPQAPEADAIADIFREIEISNTPRLMATLTFDTATGLWHEAGRHFVVPDSWPGC